MASLLPLPAAIPFLAAGIFGALSRPLASRRRVLDLAAIGVAVAVGGVAGLLVAGGGPRSPYWFGGWRPLGGVVRGVDFTFSPLGAGLALLVAVLVAASLAFSWRYFEAVGATYHVLMMVFLGAMEAFCLTGDLFDAFVYFELMGVAAFALTGYRVEEKGPIQGALNFAILNSLGAYVSLAGIALVFGASGTLNMAALGVSLAGHVAASFVAVAFVLIAAGLLVKSAIVPFHFWLADAHAVAPTPVCALFSGVMVEIGTYGIARIYWDVFSGAPPGLFRAIGTALVVLGAVSALGGAAAALAQRHLKRLLAFSTISHSGLFLVGLGLGNPAGLAATAAFVLGHGLLKASLFFCTGIVLHRLGGVNERELWGRGRPLFLTGTIFMVSAAALCGLPPFLPALAAARLAEAASQAGSAWVGPVASAAAVLSGAAVLRAGARIFWGVGSQPEPRAERDRAADEERSETISSHDHTPASMLLPPAALTLAAVVVGLAPGVSSAIARSAARMEDQAGYARAVLGSVAGVSRLRHALAGPPPLAAAKWLVGGMESLVAGLVVAAAALFVPAITPSHWKGSLARRSWAVASWLQSGRAGDYAAWFALGLAALGAGLVGSSLG